MDRMLLRTVVTATFFGIGCVPALAAEAATEQTPGWTDYADCAAGYLANWQDRLTKSDRSREMSAMIHTQSDEYRRVAARLYQSASKTTPDLAADAVETRVRESLPRFTAMDKAGKLESFIDECPQTDDSDQD
jgi:hypothetical protein